MITIGSTISPALGRVIPSMPQAESSQDQARQLMVVTADDTPIRCGDQDVFYAIAMMKGGSFIETLGESGNYTRVVIPGTVGVFVPINEVDSTPNKDTVVLTADSKLRAPSHLMGLAGSWKAVYSKPLPKGTSLKVIETLLSDSGAVLGYRVTPVLGVDGEYAVGYIKSSALRAMTPEELKSLTEKAPAQPTLDPESTKPTPEPAEHIDESEASEHDQAGDNPANENQAVDTSLLEDMDLDEPAAEPVEIENSAPIDAEGDAEVNAIGDADDAGNATPAATESSTKVADHGLISVSALEDLESAFDRARSMSKEDLDESLDELRAEYSRAREQAEDGSSLAKALDQRLEWIDIRIQTRDQRRSIAAMLAQYDANQDQVAQAIKKWQAGRAYQLVGRMVTSSIYTGDRLPLLYRIQATDPATGLDRTIGYVAPNESQDLRHMLGRVVGVVGTVRQDESLKLMVIAPDRIELMGE
ncbi:MAG: hypothetical protein ACWA5W_11215 [Phycisphaerales bacterium]